MTDNEVEIQDDLALVIKHPNLDHKNDPAAKYHGRSVFLRFPDRLDVSEEDAYAGMRVTGRVVDVKESAIEAVVMEVDDDGF